MRYVISLCTTSIFLLMFLMNAHAQTELVKVGCLFPLTGPGGLYGRDSAIAVQMAREHIQTDALKFEVKIEDTRSKVLRSVQIAQSFIEDDDVDFLCGVVSSSIARAVSAKAFEHEVFFVGTDHASPSLVTSDLHPFYFRVNNGTRQSMLAGAKYIAQNHTQLDEPVKISFIGPDYDYGYQAWDDLRAFLTDLNVDYQVVGEYWPKLFETDYTLYIQQIMASQADIVISGHWGLDLVTFVKQARQFKLFAATQFMNFDAGGNYEVFAELGNDMPLGLILSSRHHVNWPPTERNKSFVDTFYERAGRYPSYAAQGAYSGILAIAEAVKNAGGADDKSKIREALETLELALPEDPEGFKSKMDSSTHQLMQVQAIGKTVFNNSYPPATVQLGEWSVYEPPGALPIVVGKNLLK